MTSILVIEDDAAIRNATRRGLTERGLAVTTADGRGVVYRHRDRRKMLGLLLESMRRQSRLARRFDHMRQVYREALPTLSSKQKWESVLLPESGRHA